MTTRELHSRDNEEVCEPKPWHRADLPIIGSPNRGKVDFDLGDDYTVIAALRVIPGEFGSGRATIEFGSNVDYLTIREVNGVRIRIANATDGQDTRDAKIAQAQRSIDQSADATEDLETGLADMLANVYHWCDEHGVDYYAAAERAERYKIDELADWAAEAEQNGASA